MATDAKKYSNAQPAGVDRLICEVAPLLALFAAVLVGCVFPSSMNPPSPTARGQSQADTACLYRW